jgi:hypothetical protein
MLGHAPISQTMATYSHILPGMQDTAVSAMERPTLTSCVRRPLFRSSPGHKGRLGRFPPAALLIGVFYELAC